MKLLPCVRKNAPNHSCEYGPVKPCDYVKEYENVFKIYHPITESPQFTVVKKEAKNYWLVVDHTLKRAFPVLKSAFNQAYEVNKKDQHEEEPEEKAPKAKPKKAKKRGRKPKKK